MVKLIFLGISLEVIAALLGTVSKQLIAYTENVHGSGRKNCTLGCGFFLSFIVGPIVDAAAYAFAPQTVIAPFASLDVLFNAISAPCTLGFQREYFTWMHWAAALLVSVGAACTALSGPIHDDILTPDIIRSRFSQPKALTYFIAELILVVIAIIIIKRGGKGRVQGMLLGGVSGLLIGNSFLTKAFVCLVRHAVSSGDWSAFTTVTPYVILFVAIGGSAVGAYFMQRGLRSFKGVYMVTILDGVKISCGCISGDIVLGELQYDSWKQWASYWSSVGAIISGIVLINYASKEVELQRDSPSSQRLASLPTGLDDTLNKPLISPEMQHDLIETGVVLDGDVITKAGLQQCDQLWKIAPINHKRLGS